MTKVLWVEELVSSLFAIKAEDQDINLALLFLKVMLYTFCRFFKKPSTNPMGNYGNENSKKRCAKTRSSCLYVYFVFCFFICCGVLFCFLLLVVGFEMWFLARAKGTAAINGVLLAIVCFHCCRWKCKVLMLNAVSDGTEG